MLAQYHKRFYNILIIIKHLLFNLLNYNLSKKNKKLLSMIKVYSLNNFIKYFTTQVRSKDLVQALCHTILQMSRQIVAMETHVVGSGHRLVDKVSQEGVWYLEEVAGLLSNGGNVLKVFS